MNTIQAILKNVVYLPLIAFVVTVGCPELKAAGKQRPFHGTIHTEETVDAVVFPIVFDSSVGNGNATHLGRFAWVLQVQINFTDPIFTTATGTGVLTAANGDRLFTEFTATGDPTENPDVIFITEVHTITGGTGRFTNATGFFTRQALSNLALGFSSGVFEGSISY